MPEAALEITQQIDFDFGTRRKIGVPAFAGPDTIPFPVPIESSLAETGARRNHTTVSFRRDESRLQRFKLRVGQRAHPVGIGSQIIE
jgi:hypothetical protein